VNAHYLFPLGDRLTVYPLAGAGFLGYSYGSGYGYGGLASHSDLAFNLGGGIDIQLAGSLYLNAEAKYKISDYWDRLLLSAGLSFKF
jgi:outer membrane protein X